MITNVARALRRSRPTSSILATHLPCSFTTDSDGKNNFFQQFFQSEPSPSFSLVGFDQTHQFEEETTTRSPSTWLQDILDDILLMAVPKRKTTRSKTRIKNYRKRIVPDIKHIQICELCGATKLRHILCECVVKDESWKEHRDDNSWLNAGNMNANDGDEMDAEVQEVTKAA